MNGKLLYSENSAMNSIVIDLSVFSSGVYLIKDDDGVARFVVR